MSEYDQIIEKKISPLVESMFPEFYLEEGPLFVEFVKQYYIWMESAGNPLYHSRRILEYKDIDLTTDAFLVHYKNKYLQNIKINSYNSTRNLVKHSLDLYRSKGTERGIDLLFRAEFGTGAEVYYPRTDLFRLSDGKFKKTNYLEVALNNDLHFLVNREVKGQDSGAKAFVERVIRRTIKNRLIDVVYISAVNGTFKRGERFNTIDNLLPVPDMPLIIGSLSDIVIDVNGTGTGFAIGDVVDVVSDSGSEAKAIVSNTASFTGLIDYELIDGGYGYTANASVIISEHVLRITDTTLTGNSYFRDLDSITQSYGQLNYLNSNGTFTVGDVVYAYTNNVVSGAGTILKVTEANTSSGVLTITLTSGTFPTLAIYKAGNTVSANLTASNGFFNQTVTANVFSLDSTLKYLIGNTSGTFSPSDVIYQNDTNGTRIAEGVVKSIFASSGSNSFLTFTRSYGFINPALKLRNATSGANADVYTATLTVGVVNATGTWTSLPGNIISANNLTGSVDLISEGQGSSFMISNNLSYSETIRLNTDLLQPYANTPLNANAYGFPGFPSANLATVIDTALTYSNTVIGKISAITSIDPGQFYTAKPKVLVIEPKTIPYNIPNFVLEVLATSSNFQVGELLVQDVTNARGLITKIDGNVIRVQNLRFYTNNYFTSGNNTITGDRSASTAKITNLFLDYEYIEGENAIIESSTVTGEGSVTELKLIDSGFGFSSNEAITFTKDGITGTGSARVETAGKSKGYYQNRNGFLSSTKKLFDGDYYQDFSYDIRSPISLDKYSAILKQVMHTSGSKFFGTFIKNTVGQTNKNKVYTEIS